MTLAAPPDQDVAFCAVFCQAGASVTLRVSSKTVLTAARDSLYSYQEQPAGTSARWQLDVACDPAVRDPGGTAHGAQCLDIGPALTACPRHRGNAGHVFWVPELGTLIAADPVRRIVRVRCAGEDAARHWARSLTRQAMTSQLLAAGMIYAHAAAFTCGGRGILAAGHGGAGKTTTLLASLHHLGGDYLTADRLLLHADGRQVRGYPWPHPLLAGIGTLSALPHLTALVPEPQRGLPLTERWAFPEKVIIQPPSFPCVLGAGGQVGQQLTVDAMIWPQLDPGCRRARIERVPPAEVFRTLMRTRMFMANPDLGTSSHVNHWLAPAPADHVAHRNLARTATALASAPCYRIHAGADPAALASAVSHALAELP